MEYDYNTILMVRIALPKTIEGASRKKPESSSLPALPEIRMKV